MAEHPDEFGGLTGVHADTVVRQLALESKFIDQVGTNPDAGRASNDNMLDIIDIIQGDTNLANMANQGGVAGFSVLPDKIGETPKYQDNADQTNFWANFIAQSNSLGQAAEAAVASGDKTAINGLITQIKAFETNSANFDQSQGGIFEARFDNELAKGNSTLGAEVAAMINGLNSGNAALVTAAAEEMHANAADVGGNNLPVNGGTYNTDGLTLAEFSARQRRLRRQERPPPVPLLRRQPPPRTPPPPRRLLQRQPPPLREQQRLPPGKQRRHRQQQPRRPPRMPPARRPQQRKQQPQQQPRPVPPSQRRRRPMLEQPPQRRRRQPQLRLLLVQPHPQHPARPRKQPPLQQRSIPA
jgi:hypothetical protein